MSRMKELDIDRLNSFADTLEDAEPTDAELKKMMRDEHVKSEAEFKDKILEGWDLVSCSHCLKDVKLNKAVFVDDSPYHKWCAEELGLL